ncbi:polyprenal reductase isoform X1 [Denticeps clupeoides]|uniref:polyprenal reductase isoform X1 n=1 Tax=Denticeps clupeoides TaxID=299321 RepID=UPI0010A4F45B|nr:polyprenol reductase isoform X1 [Denticeps clupeoides]
MTLGCWRPVDFTWFSLAVGFFVSFCLHRFSSHLPLRLGRSLAFRCFQDLIRYGKTKRHSKRPDLLRVFDVPKRWFGHFYVVSVLWSGFLITLSLRAVLLEESLPKWLLKTVGFLTGGHVSNSKGNMDLNERDCLPWGFHLTVSPPPDVPPSVLLVQILLWVHGLRRLLECLFVSVFSNGVIHLVQYAFGLVYYIFLALTVLCVDVSSSQEALPLLSQVKWYHAVGTILFLWASWLQHHSLSLLARLRTGNSGTVETLAHRMPQGCWFDLVSCPHYFAELLIYASLAICVGGGSLTWWLVVLHVLFNQALAAQLCHEFYRSKFKAYPQQRKAFIPFVL